MEKSEFKTLILDGFTQEEALAVVKAVKAAAENPKDLIFAMTTPNSRESVLKDLLEDLKAEHEYFRNQRPT